MNSSVAFLRLELPPEWQHENVHLTYAFLCWGTRLQTATRWDILNIVELITYQYCSEAGDLLLSVVLFNTFLPKAAVY